MAQDISLSNREKEVLDLLLQGKTNKQIAFLLNISTSTVEFHLKNIYGKYEVNSKVVLILKLWKTTSASLWFSTVDQRQDTADNRDSQNPQSGWVLQLKNSISKMGMEVKMKKRWSLYCLVGIIFGAAFWHYFSSTASLLSNLAYINDLNPDSILKWLLLPIILIIYFGVWLLPTTMPVFYEYKRSYSLRLSVMAVITVWICAVLGYYINYMVMLAIVGIPNMEYLVILGQRTASFWQDWGQIFPKLILFKFFKWVILGSITGGITGYLTARIYSSLSNKKLGLA